MCRGMLASALIAVLCLGLTTPAAQACKWDSETRGRENEFKSQYNGPPRSHESPAADEEAGPDYLAYLLVGAGGVLGMTGLGIGVGASVVMLRKS
jgi:hypothetical protein